MSVTGLGATGVTVIHRHYINFATQVVPQDSNAQGPLNQAGNSLEPTALGSMRFPISGTFDRPPTYLGVEKFLEKVAECESKGDISGAFFYLENMCDAVIRYEPERLLECAVAAYQAGIRAHHAYFESECHIAVLLHETGHAPIALKWLELIETMLSELNDVVARDHVHTTLVSCYLAMGRLVHAKQMSFRIHSADLRFTAYHEIVKAYANRKENKNAIQLLSGPMRTTALANPNPDQQVEFLFRIAEELIVLGKPDTAADLVESLWSRKRLAPGQANTDSFAYAGSGDAHFERLAVIMIKAGQWVDVVTFLVDIAHTHGEVGSGRKAVQALHPTLLPLIYPEEKAALGKLVLEIASAS